jgi:hypothetical protein
MDYPKRPIRENKDQEKIECGTESVWFSTPPLNAAMKAAQKFLGPQPKWNAVNPSQTDFLAKFYKDTPPDYPFVKSLASTSSTELNAFMAAHGFPEEKFQPLIPSTQFGCAGVMDFAVAWNIRADETKLTGREGKTYDAVKFSKGKGFSMFHNPDYAFPVVKIMGKSDFNVYLTYLATPPKNEALNYFTMYELAERLTKEEGSPQKLDVLIFPKINYEGTINTDWLLNFEVKDLHGVKWWIFDAIMKSRLRLNHIGARVQSMAGLAVMMGIPPPPITYTFDRPFLIWFTYQDRVMHAAYITEEHWKDPGDNIFDPILNAELNEDIHNDSKVEFPLYGYRRIIADNSASIDLTQKEIAVVQQLDDGTLLVEIDVHDLKEQISLKPIRSFRMQDSTDRWKYYTTYREQSSLSLGDYSIQCQIEIWEHISTFHLTISNLGNNSMPSNGNGPHAMVSYSYNSIIKRGYADFKPFLTLDYHLGKYPSPYRFPPINYQQRLEMYQRMIQTNSDQTQRLQDTLRKRNESKPDK